MNDRFTYSSYYISISRPSLAHRLNVRENWADLPQPIIFSVVANVECVRVDSIRPMSFALFVHNLKNEKIDLPF